jgi:protein-S-isoprenylcysteine O-methyltransferase Ste14
MEPERPTRPGLPFGAKVLAVLVLLFLAWVAFSFVFSLVGRAIALLGYVVVAVVAYYVGKFSGRTSGRADSP